MRKYKDFKRTYDLSVAEGKNANRTYGLSNAKVQIDKPHV